MGMAALLSYRLATGILRVPLLKGLVIGDRLVYNLVTSLDAKVASTIHNIPWHLKVSLE